MRKVARAAGLMVILERPERDIVTKPFGLFVSVGVATDVHQKSRVVDRRTLFFVEPQKVCQTNRDDALAQDVLHRLAKTKIHAERKGADQLRQTNWGGIGLSHGARP